jgi:hypothetical protein
MTYMQWSHVFEMIDSAYEDVSWVLSMADGDVILDMSDEYGRVVYRVAPAGKISW